MKPTKQQILLAYKKAGEKAQLSRELLYTNLQEAGEIPADKDYSDENYYEFIGKDVSLLANPDTANAYFTNLTNIISKVDFHFGRDNRNELFDMGVHEMLPYGDHIKINFTNPAVDIGYNKESFVPTATSGGNLLMEQIISLSDDAEPNNADKRYVNANIPYNIAYQAINMAITTGLAGGILTIFDEQLQQGINVWKYNRMQYMLALVGGKCTNNMWTKTGATFTANADSFVEVDPVVTDSDSFLAFLVKFVLPMSETWNAQYDTKYNPAGINQLVLTDNQVLILDKTLAPYWRNTQAVLFNGEMVDPKKIFKKVIFMKLPDNKVNTTAKTPYAILTHTLEKAEGEKLAIAHWPMQEGIVRMTQMWGQNKVLSVWDHFWFMSGIMYDYNMVVFYPKVTP